MSEAAEPTAKKQKVDAEEAEEKAETIEETKEDEKKADGEEVAAEKEEAAPAEAPAADADGAKTGELQRGDDGVAYIMLSPKKRVLLKPYRGEPYIYIQEVTEKKGKVIPGKKGIGLSLPQYEALRDAISKGLVDQEVEKMKS